MSKVFINAGHTRREIEGEGGAVGLGGLVEGDVTYDISNYTANYLRLAGIDVMVYQDDDLEDIVDEANEYDPDLFISFHCNAAENRNAEGTEIFTTVGETQSDKAATRIMAEVQNALPELYIRADYADGDVDKERNFYVIRYTNSPAVLIEVAFISNPKEELLLRDFGFKDSYAKAVADGVLKFLYD